MEGISRMQWAAKAWNNYYYKKHSLILVSTYAKIGRSLNPYVFGILGIVYGTQVAFDWEASGEF